MREVAIRVWREPAVFFGLLAVIAEVVLILATGDPWDAAAIAAVILPLVEALGIRALVTPNPPGGRMTETEVPKPGPGTEQPEQPPQPPQPPEEPERYDPSAPPQQHPAEPGTAPDEEGEGD